MNEWGYYVDNLFSPDAELLIVCSISSSPAELFSANVAINFLSSSWNHKVTSIALFPNTASTRVKNNRNGNMDIISKSKLALDFSLPPVHDLYWYEAIRHTRFSICDLQSSQISASDKTEDEINASTKFEGHAHREVYSDFVPLFRRLFSRSQKCTLFQNGGQ